MRTTFAVLTLIITFALTSNTPGAAPTTAPSAAPATAPTEFHGYARQDFTLDGCACILVSPKSAAPGNPWIWRAKFFDAFPQLDLALLEKGYHLAYMEIGNTFGAPSALEHWDVF